MRPVSDLKRRVAPFEVVTDMVPAGDQPRAIAEMEKRLQSGAKDTVLLGATGTGKTATVAWLAELDRETGDLWAELRRRAKRRSERPSERRGSGRRPGREADRPAG